jgi:hypothetical protein
MITTEGLGVRAGDGQYFIKAASDMQCGTNCGVAYYVNSNDSHGGSNITAYTNTSGGSTTGSWGGDSGYWSGTSGQASNIENRPPYYALAYIMKL